MKPGYFKELDGIRGIAALMVMYFHFWIGVEANGSAAISFLAKTSVFGQTGVTLFFVLSGFLITRILLATKTKSNFFKSFYIRRSLRIFPLYYVALAIYLFLAPAIYNKAPIPFSAFWSFWVYLQNLPMTFKGAIDGPLHFWSLAVEEHFYLFWPLLVYFLSTRQLLFTSWFLILLAIIFRIILLQNGYEVFYFTLTTMDSLAIGAILAIKEKTGSLASNFLSRYFWVLLLLCAGCISLWLFLGGKGLFFIQAFKGTLIAAVYCILLLIVIATAPKQKSKSFLLYKPLIYTGKISYGLYVYHVLCYFIFAKYINTGYHLLNFAGCLTLSFFVASISYFLFEKKFILLKDKIGFIEGLQTK